MCLPFTSFAVFFSLQIFPSISSPLFSVYFCAFNTCRYRVRLPRYVTCTQCVLQWTYYTGNMWGKCANGTEAVGCGRPETFRNCADVAITSNTGGVPPLFVGKKNPFLLYYKDLRAPEDNNVFPLVVR